MSTIKILLRNKKNKEGQFPVILRIIKDGKSKLISLGLTCNINEWDSNLNQFKKNHPNFINRNRVLLKQKEKALKIIDEYLIDGRDFTLDDFESKFRNISKKSNDEKVVNFFNELIEEMTKSGRLGNVKAFKDTTNSLIKFAGTNLKFKDITSIFLDKYEVFLRENGNNDGGIAFKMRELRSVYNKAIKRKLISKEYYPFEDYKISKLKPKASKTALTIQEFKKIRDINLSCYPNLIEAHNYFLFSVYTRGMNFQDMMLLKWSDISNGRIYYIRSKTKGKINQEIIEPVQEILDYYKTINFHTQFVFPILLSDDLTPQQIANRKHKVLRRYNSKMKKIAELAGIDKKVTSYVARHSFATILKKEGTPIEKISEMMGHKDVSITMAYLKEFSNEELDKENRKFIDM